MDKSQECRVDLAPAHVASFPANLIIIAIESEIVDALQGLVTRSVVVRLPSLSPAELFPISWCICTKVEVQCTVWMKGFLAGAWRPVRPVSASAAML